MSEGLLAFLVVLLLFLVAYFPVYYWMYGGPDGRLSEALEAAAAGDTRDAICQLNHLLTGWEKSPKKWYSPMYVACRMVTLACECEWPETAQAVLDHLGFTRSELMWEEEGYPSVPLLDYVREHPEYEYTASFLQAKES